MKYSKQLIQTGILLFVFLLGAAPCEAFKGMGSARSPAGGTGNRMDLMKEMGHDAERDAVVARVNGIPLTMGALMDSIMEEITINYGGTEVTGTVARQIRQGALEKLVMEELACQRAASLGITVDPAFIKARIEAHRAAAGGEEGFNKMLADQNKSVGDLERQIERFFLVKKVVDREVTARLTVDDDEINGIYEANREQFADPEVVIVTDIVFFLDPDEPASRERVNAIKKKVIEELSGDAALLKEEDILVQTGLSVSPAYRTGLYEQARTMEQGSLSGPLNIDGTLHLIKLERYKSRVEQPADQAKAFIASRVKSSRKNELLTEWRQGLRNEAEIEIVHEMLK